MAMFPPFFDTLKNVAAVKAIFGNSPRITPHGMADHGTTPPYAVYQIITGSPENFLWARPDADSFSLQVDVYAKTPQEAADGAEAIRDAIEPVAYITAWRGQFKDPDTTLMRYSFDIDFITPRI
jgi:hypothetical protein